MYADLCLEVEGNLVVGAKVLVNQNALTEEEEDNDSGVANENDQQIAAQETEEEFKSSGKL